MQLLVVIHLNPFWFCHLITARMLTIHTVQKVGSSSYFDAAKKLNIFEIVDGKQKFTRII